MGNKSIRFLARDLCKSIESVCNTLTELGLIDEDGNITDEGRHNGVRESSWYGVPTFPDEVQDKISPKPDYGKIYWYCDNCKCFMNRQPGFNTNTGEWVCEECGFINDVTESNIRHED